MDVATPYARKFLGLDSEGARQTIQSILSQLLEAGRILLKLPADLERVITRLETGQIEVKTDSSVHPARSRRGRNGNQVASSGEGSGALATVVTFIASLGGGILLTNAHQVIPGWIFLGLAGLMGLRLLFRR